MTDLIQARLAELLDYCPLTGVFTWKSTGKRAGTITERGYRRIKVDGRSYRAARLAWFYTNGAWPSGEADHRNGVRDDDRVDNLRDVDHGTNTQNVRTPPVTNTSGFLGVTRHRLGWMASISVSGRRMFLGYHKTPQAAHAAYVAAKREHHKGCTL